MMHVRRAECRARHEEVPDRRKRVLRAGSLQVLWALLLVYLILLGSAFLFGREAGDAISFGVCLGLAALVTVAFLAIYLFDRLTAAVLERIERYRERKQHESR